MKAIAIFEIDEKIFDELSNENLSMRLLWDYDIMWEQKSKYFDHVILRPLPQKQKLIVTGKNQIEKKKIIESKSLEWIKKGYINNPEVAFYCGYNECLDEITGEIE